MVDIKDWEGLYAVTSCGKVWSYRSKQWLNPYDTGRGYVKVDLRDGERRKQVYVHRLVAEAYIPNPLGLDTVNHKDEIKTHNYVGNLEWMSQADNVKYGTGSQRSAKKRSKPVYCIELDRVFESGAAAARELGMSNGNLSYHLSGHKKSCGTHPETKQPLHWRFVE